MDWNYSISKGHLFLHREAESVYWKFDIQIHGITDCKLLLAITQATDHRRICLRSYRRDDVWITWRGDDARLYARSDIRVILEITPFWIILV